MNIIWNAHVDVGNAKVGLGWGVTDDKTGRPLDYDALITLALPQGANASVSKQSPNETVKLIQNASLAYGPDTIEAIVTYLVSPKPGANGTQVAVNVADDAGMKPPPTGGVLGHATGQVGQVITVQFVILC